MANKKQPVHPADYKSVQRLGMLWSILALFLLVNLVSSCGVNQAEIQAQSRAREIDSIYAYQEFIATYPESKSRTEFEQRISELEVEKDWARATRLDTADSYQSFLAAHPQATQQSQAEQRLEWLKVDEARDHAAYRAFIEANPESKFARRAKQRLVQLDFWNKSQRRRKKFLELLMEDPNVSSDFHPETVEFAIDLLQHELYYEALAVLAVVDYHANHGSMACLDKSMELLSMGMDDFSYANLNKANRYTEKAKVFQNLDYASIMRQVQDKVVEPELETTGDRSLLELFLERAQEQVPTDDLAQQLVGQVQASYPRPVFPEFVDEAVDFLSTGEFIDSYILVNLPVPGALPAILSLPNNYCNTNLFRLLRLVTSQHPEQMLELLENQNTAMSQTNIIYGFGLAQDHSARDKVMALMNGSSDPHIKVAGWYYLTQIGDDHTPQLNSLLGLVLDPNHRSLENATSLGINLFEEDKSWDELGGEILSAYQWMSFDCEKRIDGDLLLRAMMNSDHEAILFFAMAVMKDLEVILEGDAIDRLMTLVKHDKEKITNEAQQLVEQNIKGVLAHSIDYLEQGNSKQRASILQSLNTDAIPELDQRLKNAVDAAVASTDEALRSGAIHAISTYKLTEYRDKLLEWIDNENYGLLAGITFIILHENPQEGLEALKSENSDNAMLIRCLFEDEEARSKLLRNIRRSPIQELAKAIITGAGTQQGYFFEAIRGKTHYRNSRYAPTDYYVAFAAQQSAILMLLENPDLRK